MSAIDTFRAAPFRHNCAQAVANQWRHLYSSSDIVADYQPYVAGGAPGGLCGALYAATQAVPEHAEEIAGEFEAQAGSCKCREIKTITKFPCQQCVILADKRVGKYSSRK